MFKLKDNDIAKCSDDFDAPLELYTAKGGVLSHKQKTIPLLCGGYYSTYGDPANQFCYIPGGNYNENVTTLQEMRAYAASLTINNGETLWITGGYYEEEFGYRRFYTHDTTEFINVKEDQAGSLTFTVTPGPDLPVEVYDHCLVQFDENTVFLMGGVKNQRILGDDYYTTFSETWVGFNMTSDSIDWLFWQHLSTERQAPACGMIKDSSISAWILIAAGGYTGSDIVTNSVDIVFMITDNNDPQIFHAGPVLPTKLNEAETIVTPDSTKLLVIGGEISYYPNAAQSQNILQFQCWNLDCSWQKLDQELAEPKSRGVALLLPPGADLDIRLLVDLADSY